MQECSLITCRIGIILVLLLQQVRSLLMKVCDETEIAELRLKVGPFMLHMKRNLEKAKDSVLAVAHTEAAPVPSKSKVDSTPVHSPPSKASNGTSSMGMISSFNSRPATLFRLLVAAADEGLLFITSPKVDNPILLFHTSSENLLFSFLISILRSRTLCESSWT